MFTNYKINDIEKFETPEHLIFESKVNHNISTLISMVQDVNRLVPHAKTHKSKEMLNHLIDRGITRHKTSTINELEILGECEPQELILSYPIASKIKAQRLQKIINKFPKTNYSSIVSSIYHVELLNDLEGIHGVYIDLDTGMHRTGVSINELDDLLDFIMSKSNLDLRGIHAYDGHMHAVKNDEIRSSLAAQTLKDIRKLQEKIYSAYKFETYDIIVGGSWSFHFYLDQKDIKLSPGTWIYWDATNAEQKELDFQIAGVVLGQVVDNNEYEGTATIDIGAKAISCDPPTEKRLKLIDKPNAILVHQNEEHGVIKLNGETLNIGDYVLAEPGHACTVTPKYSHAIKIDANGDISGKINSDARDRKI
jgi:D-serine deaminase-like pyridoxal phosphate-dependent protein